MIDPSAPRPGAIQIRGEALRDCAVEADGARVRLGLFDEAGTATDLSLPTECLAQLVMTLPRLADEALRRRFGDDSLRLVYPLGGWRMETTGEDGTLILTLSTADGFAVSFAILAEKLRDMAEAATARPDLTASTH